MLFSLHFLSVQRPLTSSFRIIYYKFCCSSIWNGRQAPAGPAVLRVKIPLEVYLRAWIVTPFRGIFSIINILARSRSNRLKRLSLHDQLRILSFCPFLFVLKNMTCFCDIYVIEVALRASFFNSSLASSFCACLQRVKLVRDSSRSLIKSYRKQRTNKTEFIRTKMNRKPPLTCSQQQVGEGGFHFLPCASASSRKQE